MQALLWVSKQNIKKKLEFPHFLPHASWKAWSEREITSQGFIGQIWEEKLRCLQRDDDDVLDHDAPRWHTWQTQMLKCTLVELIPRDYLWFVDWKIILQLYLGDLKNDTF